MSGLLVFYIYVYKLYIFPETVLNKRIFFKCRVMLALHFSISMCMHNIV